MEAEQDSLSGAPFLLIGSYRTVVGRLRPASRVYTAGFGEWGSLEHSHASCIALLSMAAFVLQRQS